MKRSPAHLGAGILVAGALLWFGSPVIHAMIDPSFTPLHMVEGAHRIVCGKLAPSSQPGSWELSGARVLKSERSGPGPGAALAAAAGLAFVSALAAFGTRRLGVWRRPVTGASLAAALVCGVLALASRAGTAGPRFTLEIARAGDAEDARGFLASSVGADVVLFEGPPGAEERTGYLIVEAVWMRLASQNGREWRITRFDDQRLVKTYFGAADKLVEMTEYILHDEDPDVPVAVGVSWRERLPVGRAGAVTGMASLGGARLFVASTEGDRLFVYDTAEECFRDRTKGAGLGTASREFALVDLDRDGRADLVSWDGRRIRAAMAREDGSFALTGEAYEWREECAGLAPVSPSQDGSPGVLVSAKWPRILTRDRGEWSASPLPGEGAQHASVGSGLSCVVADLDSDGCADILQLREKESLLWQGIAGGFAEPVRCAVTSGGAPARWCIGDLDTDGGPDLFISGSERCELWESRGREFQPVIDYAGSLQFLAGPGASDCLATDLNHDGRPDVALLYPRGSFSYHFNRGYRCMAEEGELRLDGGPPGGPVPEDAPRPVRAVAGDLDGDGALDLAVAFDSGEVACVMNGEFEDPSETPAVRIRLPKGHTGPVTVSVWQGSDYQFCVGTCVVPGHSPPVHANLRRPGPCVLRWRWPGGPGRESTAEEGAEVVLLRAPAP